MSACPDHPDLEVHRLPGTPRVRKTTAILGVSHPKVFRVHNTGINALERAVKERVFNVKRDGVFTAPFRPRSHDHFFDSLAPFTRGVAKHLPKTVPVSARVFVDSYRGRKRVVYEQALSSLVGKQWEAKDAKVKVFVKFEKFNYSLKPDAVPRVISPRSPRFNVCIGRYIRPIEERIFDAIGELYGSKTVMKGMNAADSGRLMYQKWASFHKPVAIGLDAERFDQHVSVSALMYEHRVYESCFWRKKDRNMLNKLCRQQLENKCRGYTKDGWLKYTVEGGRMSGDMNTSLGNCVLMCAMVWSYASSIGVKVQLANNGDDCVVFMEQRDLIRFRGGVNAWFRDMGFSMVVEAPSYELERLEFCQTRPVWVGPGIDDYVMCRNPNVAIPKDAVALHNLVRPQEVAGWLAAVGEGGISLTGGLPVWQEFYLMYKKSAVGKRAKVDTGWSWGMRKLAEGMDRKFSPVSHQTRYSFWLAFDVSPEQQVVIEQHYRKMRLELVDGDHAPHAMLPLS